MDVLRHKSTVVSRLKIKANQIDSLATRLRLENLFAAADFEPAGLPATAIVCLKKLHDPRPKTLDPAKGEMRLPTRWQNSVVSEIERLTSRAVRPAWESVPGSAESVYFADSAELLACLARDWCSGSLHARWWWKSLFSNLVIAENIARIWLESSEYAPAAFEHLARAKMATVFVGKLQPNEAESLLQAVVTSFGLNKIQAVLFESDERAKFVKARFAAPVAPWARWVPELATSSLGFEQQVLLGIGLTLFRAPQIVRLAEFAAKIHEWRFKTEAAKKKRGLNQVRNKDSKVVFDLDGKAPQTQSSEFYFQRQVENQKPVHDISAANKPRANNQSKKDLAEQTNETLTPEITTNLGSENLPKPANDLRESGNLTKKLNSNFERKIAEFIGETNFTDKPVKPDKSDSSQKAVQNAATQSSEIEYPFEIVIETRFGGIFFLLNLALYLDLYADFTRPLETGIDLNIWDFVALVGRELIGGEIEADAVWDLLANLAGREKTQPAGDGFAPSLEWRMPSKWLKTFPTSANWLWTNKNGRLNVYHPAGFCVFDVFADEESIENSLESELETYDVNRSSTIENDDLAIVNEADLTPAQFWLQYFLLFAKARLQQALNIDSEFELNQTLSARRARIVVTATHFEAFFKLADLPLAIRLSGLDRNPNWIPAAGKFVAFHFV
ncbi:MAG: hypothetical protein ABI954_15120 [Pyrinomonadaceae bacterium]